MRKLLAILMVLGLVLCMLPVAAAVELPMELGEAVDQVSAYFTSVMGEGVYSDWAVLQLARSGNLTEAMRQDYLDTLEKTLKDCGGVLDESFYTPYSRHGHRFDRLRRQRPGFRGLRSDRAAE